MEKVSASKFVAGFNATGFMKAFSIGMKLAMIIGLGYAVYVTVIQPHTKWRVASTIQKAEQITNIDNHPKGRHHIELLWGVIRLW